MTEHGAIYSWGWSKYGQTGLGTTKSEMKEPRVVEVGATVVFKDIACGDKHTIALTGLQSPNKVNWFHNWNLDGSGKDFTV